MAAFLRIKRVQVEMACDRKFVISPNERGLLDPRITVDDFSRAYSQFAAQQRPPISFREALTNVYTDEKKERSLLVFYAQPTKESKQLGIDVVKKFVDRIHTEGHTHAIFITGLPLSGDSRDAIAELVRVEIQVFLDYELMYNPTKHVLVPKHQALSPEEQREFLLRGRVKSSQLPNIKRSDPVAKYYGFQPGQIIRIDRVTITFDTPVTNKITYRVVNYN